MRATGGLSYSMEQRDPHTVLLIEDNPDDASLMQRALEKAGVKAAVHIVNDGKQALEYLKGVAPYHDPAKFLRPHLVLLDLQLPEMHGLKVLEWIRSQPGFSSLVVVVLSSSNKMSDVQLAYKLGCNSYLLKPATLDRLYETVGVVAAYWLSLNQWP
jgi:CheY-like chemotaxis protein